MSVCLPVCLSSQFSCPLKINHSTTHCTYGIYNYTIFKNQEYCHSAKVIINANLKNNTYMFYVPLNTNRYFSYPNPKNPIVARANLDNSDHTPHY